MDNNYFNLKPKRDAEFIKPPNIIKAKVGSGGISERTLDRAQKILESHASDFTPVAQTYLNNMMIGIQTAKKSNLDSQKDPEALIAGILYPCVQLKANGSMFHFPLVTKISGRFVQFMEVIDILDNDILELAAAFHTTVGLIIHEKIKGDPGAYGEKLFNELNNACIRYFEKHKTA